MKTSRAFTGFEYLTPKTVEEACSLLSRYKGEARIIAGGTDLMVMIKSRDVMPAYVITLEGIPDLNYIRHSSEGLKIGAMATMADVVGLPIVQEKFSVLADAVREMGSPQIRNTATVAGNLCRAAPSADTAAPLLALGAKVKIASSSGERVVGLEDFFLGPGETILHSDEMLTEIQVSNPLPSTLGAYVRAAAREAVAIAQVGVAIVITLDANKTNIADARIVLGAVAPTPIRATQAEDILKGEAINDELIEKAAQAAAAAAKPISDIRGSAEYRMEMVKVLVNQALMQIAISG